MIVVNLLDFNLCWSYMWHKLAQECVLLFCFLFATTCYAAVLGSAMYSTVHASVTVEIAYENATFIFHCKRVVPSISKFSCCFYISQVFVLLNCYSVIISSATYFPLVDQFCEFNQFSPVIRVGHF